RREGWCVMRVAVSLALLLIAAQTLAAPVPQPRRSRPPTSEDDLKSMQGGWTRLSCTGGTVPPVPRPLNDTVVIAENRITYNDANATWTLTLGTQNGKRTFDIQHTQGGQVWLGLYELKGDSLRVCFTPSKIRPNDIEPSKSDEYLQTFRKQKP